VQFSDICVASDDTEFAFPSKGGDRHRGARASRRRSHKIAMELMPTESPFRRREPTRSVSSIKSFRGEAHRDCDGLRPAHMKRLSSECSPLARNPRCRERGSGGAGDDLASRDVCEDRRLSGRSATMFRGPNLGNRTQRRKGAKARSYKGGR
jgi:hypothetical protein